MRRPNIDKIEIVEPPIEELSKHHSGFRRTCLTGCSSVILFVIAIIIAVWLAIGPGPKTIKTLPAHFPIDIPLYDKDNIEQITFISGKYKSRGLELAAFFPKIILSPLLLRTNSNYSTASEPEPTPSEEQSHYLKRIWQLIQTPVGDPRDSIEIEWKNLDAEPGFIMSYYKKELRKAGYTISEENQNSNSRQITFNKNDTAGTLTIARTEEQKIGTAYALLTLNFAPPSP